MVASTPVQEQYDSGEDEMALDRALRLIDYDCVQSVSSRSTCH